MHEEIKVYRRADRLRIETGRSGLHRSRGFSEDGYFEATFYNWKKKYGGLGVSELRHLKQLEDENARLKRLVADLSLDKQMLQEVVQKTVKPVRKRELANFLIQAYRVSIRRATAVLQLRQATYFYNAP